LSFDVRIWAIQVRDGRRAPWRVRWVVSGSQHSESFTAKGLAEGFRAKLVTAAGKGEDFDPDTGLPASMLRKLRDLSFYEHCMEYAAASWKVSSANTRMSLVETLSRVIPVVAREAHPDPALLRSALRKNLNHGEHAPVLTGEETRAVAMIRRASRPVSALGDPGVVADVLDALAVNLDGKPAAPQYFSRRRRVLHLCLAYAVRKRRLSKNPLAKVNLPEGWSAPQRPDDVIDPRCVGGPELVSSMLEACSSLGVTQGKRFTAFYGCMFWAMMRPSEVAGLTVGGCHLPVQGWGRLTFDTASPSVGRAFTDEGTVHEHRGLKGRTKGRPGTRKPPRSLPIPPELVTLLRDHLATFGTDRLVFRSEQGNPVQSSTWWQAWQKVRKASLSPEQLDSPLMRRPYDLRQSGITWRLNSGIPAEQVAEWAGNSAEIVTRVYAKCVAGMEDVYIARMNASLGRQP
jgi:hypothetical protein